MLEPDAEPVEVPAEPVEPVVLVEPEPELAVAPVPELEVEELGADVDEVPEEPLLPSEFQLPQDPHQPAGAVAVVVVVELDRIIAPKPERASLPDDPLEPVDEPADPVEVDPDDPEEVEVVEPEAPDPVG